MKKKNLIIIIICFFILLLFTIVITTYSTAKLKEKKTIKNIEKELIGEYNNYWLIYEPIIQKIETTKENEIYTARVIYYDLQYTYEDVWVIIVNDEKIQFRKVRE